MESPSSRYFWRRKISSRHFGTTKKSLISETTWRGNSDCLWVGPGSFYPPIGLGVMTFTPYFDSLPVTVQSIIKHIVKVAQPQKLVLFGSRARADHRANSDFDIVIIEKTCSESQWTKLLADISDEPFSLYAVDLVEFKNLNAEYKKHISREGKIIYECDN